MVVLLDLGTTPDATCSCVEPYTVPYMHFIVRWAYILQLMARRNSQGRRAHHGSPQVSEYEVILGPNGPESIVQYSGPGFRTTFS